MPLYAPPSGTGITPRVIFAECNSPDDGTQVAGYLWDKFYDKDTVEITAGANTVAALALLGMTYSAGVFTATVTGVWSWYAQLSTAPSPGGDDVVSFNQPPFFGALYVNVPDPNTLGEVFLGQVLFMQTGETFALISTCAGGTDLPFTYATMSITRLV